MKTFMAKKASIERKWYVIDAKNQVLGRIAVEAAKILRGKHKPIFTPHVDCGDYIIVINANKIKVTGKKLQKKVYFRHSGYIGGTTYTSLETMMKKKPQQVFELAVKGMLPKNTLGRQIYRKLNVYIGPNHPHQAQKPKMLKLSSTFN